MTTKKKTTKPKSTLKVKSAPKALPKLPNQPLVFEVLDLLSKQRAKAKKIEVLRTYDEIHLRRVLIWNFNQNIISALPEGEVPYEGFDEQNVYTGGLSAKISEATRRLHTKGNFSLGASDQDGHTTIRRESRHFYRFVQGGDNTINALRRETMFINILTGLHPLEAEILCLVKDKKLSDSYKITKEIVAEAYPDIQWGD